MLTRAKVTSGDRVLISGASGGVGSAAVQLAKARGAYVIAITSPSKNQQLLALGADQVIARDADLVEALGENSLDVVIDLVAGKQWPQFLQFKTRRPICGIWRDWRRFGRVRRQNAVSERFKLFRLYYA